MGKKGFTVNSKLLEFLLLMFLEISYVFYVVVDAIVGLLYNLAFIEGLFENNPIFFIFCCY